MLQLPISPQTDFGQFSLLNSLDSLSLSPSLLWILVGFVGLAYSIISLVLSYHWKRFGFEMNIMKRASVIYFSVSGVLLATMTISLATYLISI